MKIVRAVWWPIGWTLRTVAWVMVPPIGWALTRRRRNARRHRELVAARQPGAYVLAAPNVATGVLPACAAVHRHGPYCGHGCMYPHCDCPPNAPCEARR